VSVLRTADLTLRFAYFAIAPFFLVIMVTTFPIMGVVVNMALALAVFAFATAVRGYVERWPLLGKVLGKQLRFEEFYRENPPKPFLYYALYPLMLPYVAFNRVAQRELALYRGLTTLGLVLLVGGAVWDYYRKWIPELSASDFFKSWVAVIFVQALVSIALVMPLTTTIVTLQLQERRPALRALLAVAALSSLFAIILVARRRHDVVQQPTAERMALRTLSDPERSLDVRKEAIARALLSIRRGDAEMIRQPKGFEIYGGPIIDARDTLLRFYKEDETECFHLVAFGGKRTTLVLFGIPPRKRQIVWIGIRTNGQLVTRDDDLPGDAFATMWRTAKR
jgi:hypothetical protein